MDDTDEPDSGLNRKCGNIIVLPLLSKELEEVCKLPVEFDRDIVLGRLLLLICCEFGCCCG